MNQHETRVWKWNIEKTWAAVVNALSKMILCLPRCQFTHNFKSKMQAIPYGTWFRVLVFVTALPGALPERRNAIDGFIGDDRLRLSLRFGSFHQRIPEQSGRARSKDP